jgi:hypothetical protein
LEQCILKATRPNDEAVKQKHLDRILASVEQFDTIREHYKCEPSKVRRRRPLPTGGNRHPACAS